MQVICLIKAIISEKDRDIILKTDLIQNNMVS